jgi:HEAT repeat protein
VERFGSDADGLAADLERAGIDMRGFAEFTSRSLPAAIEASAFDYERAMPTLVKWLPLVKTPDLKEVIVRGMTGEPSATGEGATVLLDEFRRAPADAVSLKWAIANALSTLADPSLADGLVELLQDPDQGTGRQMLCEALRRTKDPRAPDVLIGLISDPSVSGHAIAALRDYGPKTSLPYLEKARPALEQVLLDSSATALAQRMASLSLERLDAAS